MSLYAKRLERGRFIWPSPADGVVAITAAQLAYMLDGIDWRNPAHLAAGGRGLRLRPFDSPPGKGESRGRRGATIARVTLPDDIEALKAALAAERARQQAEARASSAEAMVAHYKLLIAKLRREQYGQSSERGRKLLDQLELQLEELEASAAEDEAAAAPADGHDGAPLHPQEAGARALSGASAARARGDPRPDRLPVLRRQGSPSSARTSPRRWRWSRGNGR